MNSVIEVILLIGVCMVSGFVVGNQYGQQTIAYKVCAQRGYHEFQVLKDHSVRCFNVVELDAKP